MHNDYHGNGGKVIKIKKKKVFFTRKTLGAIDLKLGMHTQLQSGSNIVWVPPGHTSSFPCVRLNMPKMVYQQKHLSLRS